MDSSSANSAACDSMRSASLLMMRSRLFGGRFDQRPSSKAVREAATARYTSAAEASTMRQISLPDEGSSTVSLAPWVESTHWLLMNNAGLRARLRTEVAE